MNNPLDDYIINICFIAVERLIQKKKTNKQKQKQKQKKNAPSSGSVGMIASIRQQLFFCTIFDNNALRCWMYGMQFAPRPEGKTW